MPLVILVADDDLGIRLCISDFLEASGFTAILAQNGQEALALVTKFQPHLIITDITMPLMDGYELVRHVRQDPAFRLLPVIFLTERNNTLDRVRGYQVGCDVYLPKPFELQELGAVVRNLLDRSQMIQTAWQYTYKDAVPPSPASLAPKDLPPFTTNVGSYWGEQLPSASAERLSDPHGVVQSLTTTLPFALHFTDREQEVLALIVDGLSNVQIGDRLHLSPRTVEKHVSGLLRKTATSNRTELVHFAMKYHLAS
ncbi:chemotaxis protein CheY [Neosynechococcus sphagnicola sy1]|uniref:Chemotaxis protein CheY n=1 Tax=Neosynechococcus sphagnicola sy1 TaxID=1497020 RepID=A0A098TLD7_9CYAN|nr:response regulator transcription factor [Neosynechococcus sphagnicola]KGF73125.1 chemotaxis protein CheY [Neosynechococcus sphagnicola sy1]